MASSSSLKLNWLDHFDSAWVNEDPEAIVTRKGVVSLYEKLLSNKEAVTIPQAPLQLRGPLLPDFERGTASQNEQDQFLNDLLSSQLTLARIVSSDSPFYSTLRRRLAILQRIFCALSAKFHNKGKQNLLCGVNLNPNDQSQGKTKATDVKCGKDVLVEMGIKTGLTLLFSLLRQSWSSGQGIICNDVLATASSVLSSLPPLSLSVDSKIPDLGLESLRQVSEFLKSTTSTQSTADTNGRRLSCELLLRIGVHRGSLKCLLEWIEMALVMDCMKPEEKTKTSAIVGISMVCLEDVCRQMRKLTVSILNWAK
jgi:E3 ubiquitin-protein ligase HERC1